MADLQKTLDMNNHKYWYYEAAIAAGTEKIHYKEFLEDKLPCEVAKNKEN